MERGLLFVRAVFFWKFLFSLLTMLPCIIFRVSLSICGHSTFSGDFKIHYMTIGICGHAAIWLFHPYT
jgi:hypothetical protein